MKMNRTRFAALLSGSAVLLAGTAAVLTWDAQPAERHYQFRDELAQGRFAGYNEYLHMMRANQVTGVIDPAAVQAAWAQLLQTAQKTNTLNWESRVRPPWLSGPRDSLWIATIQTSCTLVQ